MFNVSEYVIVLCTVIYIIYLQYPMYVSQNTHEPFLYNAFENKEKTNKYQSQHPVCDGFDVYKSCLDALSHTSQHPSSAVSMCSVHGAQWVPVWTCRVCAFCVHMWTMWLWLKGGTAKAPSGRLYPVIFPSSARALNGEGGSVTSLPRTLKGGNLLTKVSAKEWLRSYTPPSKTYPPPAAPNSAAQFIRHRSEPFNKSSNFSFLVSQIQKNTKQNTKTCSSSEIMEVTQSDDLLKLRSRKLFTLLFTLFTLQQINLKDKKQTSVDTSKMSQLSLASFFFSLFF